MLTSRSTCPTSPSGAFGTTIDNTYIIGYAGAPPKLPHCDLVGCAGDPCARSVPAYLNVLLRASERLKHLHLEQAPTLQEASVIVTVAPLRVTAAAQPSEKVLAIFEAADVPFSHAEQATKETT